LSARSDACYEIGMEKVVKDVGEFMDATSDPRPTKPELPAPAVRALRIRLLREEFDEYIEAENDNDLVEIADALADLTYIAVGTALKYGIPLDVVFREVHATNMAKFPDGKANVRSDGKVLKPEGWKPPDIAALLQRHGWETQKDGVANGG